MKIIAKTKDYYDYLQGRFGVDPKLVYDRRGGAYITNHDVLVHGRNGDTILVAVAGIVYPAIWINDSWHYDRESFKQFGNTSRDKSYRRYFANHYEMLFDENHLDTTDINQELREPVLFKYDNWYRRDCWDWSKPLTLQQFNFHKVMSAEQVYIAISGFLGWLVDNPPIPDKQTNQEKIVSHGFDLKKSFRH